MPGGVWEGPAWQKEGGKKLLQARFSTFVRLIRKRKQ